MTMLILNILRKGLLRLRLTIRDQNLSTTCLFNGFLYYMYKAITE